MITCTANGNDIFSNDYIMKAYHNLKVSFTRVDSFQNIEGILFVQFWLNLNNVLMQN